MGCTKGGGLPPLPHVESPEKEETMVSHARKFATLTTDLKSLTQKTLE